MTLVLIEHCDSNSVKLSRYLGKKFDAQVLLKYEHLNKEWTLAATVEDFRKNGLNDRA